MTAPARRVQVTKVEHEDEGQEAPTWTITIQGGSPRLLWPATPPVTDVPQDVRAALAWWAAGVDS